MNTIEVTDFLADAIREGRRVWVATDTESIEGTARNIVAKNSYGFASADEPGARLWLTSIFEHFIPLADITLVGNAR